jgi:hypothetical protein
MRSGASMLAAKMRSRASMLLASVCSLASMWRRHPVRLMRLLLRETPELVVVRMEAQAGAVRVGERVSRILVTVLGWMGWRQGLRGGVMVVTQLVLGLWRRTRK